MDASAFLLQDYQLKVRYLTDHLTRMWTRFNFFVTVESALVTGLVFTRDKGEFTNSALYFLIAEAVLSTVWWVFGAQDRFLVQAYRSQVGEVWAKLAELPDLRETSLGYAGAEASGPARSPFEWRVEAISTTRLAALVPFGLLLTWLALIVAYLT